MSLDEVTLERIMRLARDSQPPRSISEMARHLLRLGLRQYDPIDAASEAPLASDRSL